eukprot:2978677-Karenia_brevis.AAC.1
MVFANAMQWMFVSFLDAGSAGQYHALFRGEHVGAVMRQPAWAGMSASALSSDIDAQAVESGIPATTYSASLRLASFNVGHVKIDSYYNVLHTSFDQS